MKFLLFLFMLLGWTFIVTGYIRNYSQANDCKRIEYRYIERDMLEEQLGNPSVYASELYTNMKKNNQFRIIAPSLS